MLEDAEKARGAAALEVQELKKDKYELQEVGSKAQVQCDAALSKLDAAQVRMSHVPTLRAPYLFLFYFYTFHSLSSLGTRYRLFEKSGGLCLILMKCFPSFCSGACC